MIWLFTLGMISLCLIHKGFRKVVFWISGALIGTFGLIVVLAQINHWQL